MVNGRGRKPPAGKGQRMKAKFDQETRDFIEGLFKAIGYPFEKQIAYLEIKERQKYNYYLDMTAGNWNWSAEQVNKYEAEWNEIIEMLNERKGAA